MFRKKIPVGRFIPPFFCKSAESGRFFIYLHDSNSIFWAQGIKSEWVLGRTVFKPTPWLRVLHICSRASSFARWPTATDTDFKFSVFDVSPSSC